MVASGVTASSRRTALRRWGVYESALICLALAGGHSGLALAGEVPVEVQSRLIGKIPAYDRDFRSRAGEVVHVLILSNSDFPGSVRAAELLRAALQQQRSVAGSRHDVAVLPFTQAAALAREVERRSVSIVYLTPGLEAALGPICKVLEAAKVLTMSGREDYVRQCVVVGFRLVGGRPRILVHLQHARRSGIRFRSELLELATVLR